MIVASYWNCHLCYIRRCRNISTLVANSTGMALIQYTEMLWFLWTETQPWATLTLIVTSYWNCHLCYIRRCRNISTLVANSTGMALIQYTEMLWFLWTETQPWATLTLIVASSWNCHLCYIRRCNHTIATGIYSYWKCYLKGQMQSIKYTINHVSAM